MRSEIWYLSRDGELFQLQKFERFYTHFSKIDEVHEVVAARPTGTEMELMCVEFFESGQEAQEFISWLFPVISKQKTLGISYDDFLWGSHEPE